MSLRVRRWRTTLALAFLGLVATARAHEEWNFLHIVYSANTEYVYPFDGRSPRIAVALLNHHEITSAEVGYTLSVNGQLQPPGAGGFASFPNGGSIVIAPFDYGYVSTLTGGVYSGQLGPPPAVGEIKAYTFQFVFGLLGPPPPVPKDAIDFGPDVDDDTDPPGTVTAIVKFTNLGDNPVLTGPLSLNGIVRFPALAGSPSPNNLLVEVATLYSPSWFRVPTVAAASGAGPAFTFAQSLQARNEWFVRISADGYESHFVALGLFDDPRAPLDVTLTPAAVPALDYRRLTAIATPTGFWRGAVSESEGTFVCFPGQENWKSAATNADARALRTASRIYKYKFDGTKLWEHAPAWETWGGDMTPDGRYVAYALNPNASFYAPTDNKLVLLDGATGAVLWTKSAAPTDTAIGRKLDSLEVALSPDAKWIAVGSTGTGQVTLVDRTTGNFAWSAPASGPSFGEVRRLRFSTDSQFLYCGSGDSFLRKLRVSDGAVLWKSFIGGSPSPNGLEFSDDGALVVTGAQSFDATLIRASDGRQVWQHDTGGPDATFSPDTRYVTSYAGHIGRTSGGALIGMTKLAGLSRFTPDGNHVLKLDRAFTLHDLAGKLLKNFGDTGLAAATGEEPQWSHVTRDGRYAIVLARDMTSPSATGIVIFERQPMADAVAPTIAAAPLSQIAAQGSVVALAVNANGTSPLSYQWHKDGADLLGATSAVLTLPNISASDAANYTCVVGNAVGSITSAPATLGVLAPVSTNPARLANISVRATVSPTAPLIAGFNLGGGAAAAKLLLLRGAAQSLTRLAISDPLPAPRLNLFSGSTVIASNDSWAGNAQVAALADQLGAFSFLGPSSKDTALLSQPTPGSYTSMITSGDGATGMALAEVYDGSSAFTADTPRLLNLSGRGDTSGAASPLIAGFVIVGPTARTVLVRGIGPGLVQFGVTNAVVDPQLVLFRGQTLIASNDNWYEAPNAVAIATTAAQVGAFVLPPTSRDAALLLTLPPGDYSAQVTGVAGTSGNALVELYEVP